MAALLYKYDTLATLTSVFEDFSIEDDNRNRRKALLLFAKYGTWLFVDWQSCGLWFYSKSI
jgi:hypothetical protein